MTTTTNRASDSREHAERKGVMTLTQARSLNDCADVSPKDWAVMVNRHPALVHQVLQIVNDSYACLPKPVASLQQAMVFLGFNTVKNLAGDLPLANVA